VESSFQRQTIRQAHSDLSRPELEIFLHRLSQVGDEASLLTKSQVLICSSLSSLVYWQVQLRAGQLSLRFTMLRAGLLLFAPRFSIPSGKCLGGLTSRAGSPVMSRAPRSGCARLPIPRGWRIIAMAFIALVAILLLSTFAAHEGRKGLTPLAIMLGVFALIACVTYSARILGIG
jgi:hypothetical protein